MAKTDVWCLVALIKAVKRSGHFLALVGSDARTVTANLQTETDPNGDRSDQDRRAGRRALMAL